MAKQKLTAGAELDLLNATEIRRELRSWSQELLRGPRFIRRSWSGTGAGAPLEIRGDGPADGFMWAVCRLSMIGHDPVNNGATVYLNEAAPSQLVWTRLSDTNGSPGDHGIVLGSGESLLFAVGGNVTADAQVTITATIKEVPALMAWAL